MFTDVEASSEKGTKKKELQKRESSKLTLQSRYSFLKKHCIMRTFKK